MQKKIDVWHDPSSWGGHHFGFHRAGYALEQAGHIGATIVTFGTAVRFILLDLHRSVSMARAIHGGVEMPSAQQLGLKKDKILEELEFIKEPPRRQRTDFEHRPMKANSCIAGFWTVDSWDEAQLQTRLRYRRDLTTEAE